jgi:hypothetical protein
MSGLLSELGKRLAEKWLTLLVLPGALYLAVGIAGHILGQTRPFGVPHLIDDISSWPNRPLVRNTGGQVVLLAAALAVSAAAGLLAQAVGSLAERLCLAPDWNTWPAALRDVARRRVEGRTKRWAAAEASYRQQCDKAAAALAHGHRLDPTQRLAAYHAMTRISLERPARPSWSGDRINAVAVRLDRDYHVDLAAVWPYLWVTMSDSTRTQVTATREAVARATTLSGWALLYLLLAVEWWPAALIAATLAVVGRQRTRAASDAYAAFLEAAVRLHTPELAHRLGLEHTGPLDAQTGEALTRLLLGPSEPPAAPAP